MPPRRIAAIVIPQLACEIARRQDHAVRPGGPRAVILTTPALARAELPATAVLDAVDDEARRFGIRPGQKVTEASALASGLVIQRITHDELEAALGCVAEVALALGTTSALELGVSGAAAESGKVRADEGMFDTVWLDVTGAAHLCGGEDALVAELSERARDLGHRVRVAIADGPRIAQAVARYGAASEAVVADGDGAHALAPLPVHALPIDPDAASFLVRLGIFTVEDLGRLPRSALTARLGARASLVLELVAGRDPEPLVVFTPPRVLEESALFEEGVESAEALLFVLRGMTSRIGARLASRGEAVSRLEVTVPYDRSIARLRLGEDTAAGETRALSFHVDLPAPLSDPNDLLRALKSKLERAELLAPAVGLALRAPQIVRARRVQLDLSQNRAQSPDALPALLAELSAEIGAERVGVLTIVDAHRHEARSALAPLDADAPRTPAPASGTVTGPTRLLAEPIPIGRVTRGRVALVDRQLFSIESLRFVMRFDAVEWWTSAPAARDYVRAWLASAEQKNQTAGEAWIYVDRVTGEGYLQGWCE